MGDFVWSERRGIFWFCEGMDWSLRNGMGEVGSKA